jgi:hypothetical protein
MMSAQRGRDGAGCSPFGDRTARRRRQDWFSPVRRAWRAEARGEAGGPPVDVRGGPQRQSGGNLRGMGAEASRIRKKAAISPPVDREDLARESHSGAAKVKPAAARTRRSTTCMTRLAPQAPPSRRRRTGIWGRFAHRVRPGRRSPGTRPSAKPGLSNPRASKPPLRRGRNRRQDAGPVPLPWMPQTMRQRTTVLRDAVGGWRSAEGASRPGGSWVASKQAPKTPFIFAMPKRMSR